MWRRVQHLDRRLMERSFGTSSPPLDHTIIAITRAANYSRLWLGLAGALAVFGGRRGRRAAGRGLAAIAIAASVANGPAKLLARRRRPSSHPALIRTPRSTSFPSGHSAAALRLSPAPALSCQFLRRPWCRWQAPLPIRAGTQAFTTQVMSRSARESESDRAYSPHTGRGHVHTPPAGWCNWGFDVSRMLGQMRLEVSPPAQTDARSGRKTAVAPAPPL
jgi:hypothetical protein